MQLCQMICLAISLGVKTIKLTTSVQPKHSTAKQYAYIPLESHSLVICQESRSILPFDPSLIILPQVNFISQRSHFQTLHDSWVFAVDNPPYKR